MALPRGSDSRWVLFGNIAGFHWATLSLKCALLLTSSMGVSLLALFSLVRKDGPSPQFRKVD